mgnify:FL=1
MEHRTTGVPRRMPCSGFPWPAFLLAVACLPLHLPRTVTSFRTNAQGLASILHSLLLSPSLLTTYHLPLLPSILATAFPFAICVLHFYTVLISCDALGGYASPSLSWPFFSSLSLVPSLSLSLSPSLSLFLPLSLFLSAFLCSIKSFSLYMVSLIYALQSPFNLPLSSFSATADFMLLRLTSSTWSTSPSNCTCPSHLRPSGGSSGCPSWQARHSPCH